MRILTGWGQSPGRKALARPAILPFAIIACGILTITGCGSFAQIERIPPEPITIRDCVIMVPDIAWSGSRGNPELWTQDGPELQALYLFKGIEDGDPLFPQRGRQEDHLVFRKDMTSHEIVELVVDSLARVGMAKVRITDLRPHPVGSKEGVQFELGYVSHSGLDGRAVGMGVVIHQRLVLALYTGVGPFYTAYKPHIEALLESTHLRPDCEHEGHLPTTGTTP